MDRLNLLLKQYALRPDDTFVLYAIAMEYEKMAKIQEAIVFFEKIIKINPRYLPVYYQFAKNLVEINDIGKAKDILDMGVKLAKAQKDIKTVAELNNMLSNIELEELDY